MCTSPPPIEPIPPDTIALALAKTGDGQSVLYAGTMGCGVLRSNDKGGNWDTFGRTRCEETAEGWMPADVRLLAVDASSVDVVYAAAGQAFFRSTDGGRSWEQYQLPTSSPIRDIVADPVRAQTVYLVTGSDGFWYTKDGGATWLKPDNRPFEEAELTTIAAVPDQAYHVIVGGSNGGVWATSDSGQNWHTLRENLAISSINGVTTSTALDGRILVSSWSDGIALYSPGRLFGKARR